MPSPFLLPLFKEKRKFDIAGLHVSFTDSLLSKLEENPSIAKKSFNALRHGFVGTSRGRKNGITLITKSDKRVWEYFQAFHCSPEYAFLLNQGGLEQAFGVKIVAHIPSGERVVGLYDPSQQKVLFYDLRCY